MLAVWAESVRRRDASIVDVFWGPAFVLVALVGALAGDGDRARCWLLLGLTAAWGLRLAVHLGRRKLGDPQEDRRYEAARARGNEVRALESPLGLRAAGGCSCSWSRCRSRWLSGERATRRRDRLGLALYALGMIFETVGDLQLARFRPTPSRAAR